jgi:hypothetical protein
LTPVNPGAGSRTVRSKPVHTATVIACRTARRAAAVVATLAILAAQSVAVAHACMRGDAAAAVPAGASPCDHADGSPAATPSGDAGGNLCEVHCQATPVPSPGTAALAPPPAHAIAVVAEAALVEGVPARAPVAKGAAPPIRARYCRLQL